MTALTPSEQQALNERANRICQEVQARVDVARQPHYISSTIQPIQFIDANGLDFFEGNIVKYVARWRHKNGVEDLRKARVYLDWLIQRAEGVPIKV